MIFISRADRQLLCICCIRMLTILRQSSSRVEPQSGIMLLWFPLLLKVQTFVFYMFSIRHLNWIMMVLLYDFFFNFIKIRMLVVTGVKSYWTSNFGYYILNAVLRGQSGCYHNSHEVLRGCCIRLLMHVSLLSCTCTLEYTYHWSHFYFHMIVMNILCWR